MGDDKSRDKNLFVSRQRNFGSVCPRVVWPEKKKKMNAFTAGKIFSQGKGASPAAELVRAALVARGLETPIIENGLSRDEKYARIRLSMTEVVETLGLDLRDDSLMETPYRIAKMYVDGNFFRARLQQFPFHLGD